MKIYLSKNNALVVDTGVSIRKIPSGSKDGIFISGGNRFYIPGVISPVDVTSIQREDGTTYADIDSFREETRDFFVNSSGTGGRVSEDHVFADDTERDVYFTTNITEVKAGLDIIVGTGLFTWTSRSLEEGSAYDSSNWHNYDAPLDALAVKALYESNDDTNALNDDKLSVLSNLRVEDGKIKSDMVISASGFESDPNTITFGQNVELGSANHGLSYYNINNGKRALITLQEFNNEGSKDLLYYNIDPIELGHVIQPLDSQVSSGDMSFHISGIGIKTQLIISFRVNIVSSGTSIMNIKVGSPSGGDITVQTVTVPPEAEGGVYDIVMENPFILESGNMFYVSIIGDIRLKGQIINDGNGDNVFVPYLERNSHGVTYETVVSRNESIKMFSNPTWVARDSVDSNITYGGFKNTGVIRKRKKDTGLDTLYISSESLPISSSTEWNDWQNRETLIYTQNGI